MALTDEETLAELRDLDAKLTVDIAEAQILVGSNILDADYYDALLKASALMDCCVPKTEEHEPPFKDFCSSYTVNPTVISNDGEFYVAVNGVPYMVHLFFFPYRTETVVAGEVTFICTPTKTIINTTDAEGAHIRISSVLHDPVSITGTINKDTAIHKENEYTSTVCVISSIGEG